MLNYNNQKQRNTMQCCVAFAWLLYYCVILLLLYIGHTFLIQISLEYNKLSNQISFISPKICRQSKTQMNHNKKMIKYFSMCIMLNVLITLELFMLLVNKHYMMYMNG